MSDHTRTPAWVQTLAVIVGLLLLSGAGVAIGLTFGADTPEAVCGPICQTTEDGGQQP